MGFIEYQKLCFCDQKKSNRIYWNYQNDDVICTNIERISNITAHDWSRLQCYVGCKQYHATIHHWKRYLKIETGTNTKQNKHFIKRETMWVNVKCAKISKQQLKALYYKQHVVKVWRAAFMFVTHFASCQIMFNS